MVLVTSWSTAARRSSSVRARAALPALVRRLSSPWTGALARLNDSRTSNTPAGSKLSASRRRVTRSAVTGMVKSGASRASRIASCRTSLSCEGVSLISSAMPSACALATALAPATWACSHSGERRSRPSFSSCVAVSSLTRD